MERFEGLGAESFAPPIYDEPSAATSKFGGTCLERSGSHRD
ncbi:hypothetical protein EV129_106378 [Rhizobium azibense]|uniref:Uncharacterized protein n=1 Tax=Rhizobium azibense TaxID=1136135 RepID=A0A4V2VEQ2_9HYPH|nr:hypothetical protein EV129_106378 [Rhizobium azibense]